MNIEDSVAVELWPRRLEEQLFQLVDQQFRPHVYLYGRGPSVHTFTCMTVVRLSMRLPVWP